MTTLGLHSWIAGLGISSPDEHSILGSGFLSTSGKNMHLVYAYNNSTQSLLWSI